MMPKLRGIWARDQPRRCQTSSTTERNLSSADSGSSTIFSMREEASCHVFTRPTFMNEIGDMEHRRWRVKVVGKGISYARFGLLQDLF